MNAVIDDRDRPSADWPLPPEPATHRAARKGDIAALERLLAHGADINECADVESDCGPYLRRLTPLMVAARSIDGASVETVRWLIDHGADVRAMSQGRVTAAWYAAGHGGRWEFHRSASTPDHVERLRLLLARGSDPKECNSAGRCLLTEACEAGDPARVRLLLEHGAVASPDNPTEAEPDWSERIHQVLHGAPRSTQRTVRCGALSSHQIPLFCAARSGSAACVRLLLDQGARVDETDDSGATALSCSGSAEAARALLDGGASVDVLNSWGDDALGAILRIDESDEWHTVGLPEIAAALVAAGAPVDRADDQGASRLHLAAFGHNAEAVEILLRLGADPRSRARNGDTPLHKICWQGEHENPSISCRCERIIDLLVAAGADVDAHASDGRTPLHEAAAGDWGSQTAIRALLRHGAQVDAVDKRGRTPLMLAADAGEVEAVRALLEGRADPRTRDRRGKSALDLARRRLNDRARPADPKSDETAQRALEEAVARVRDAAGEKHRGLLDRDDCAVPKIDFATLNAQALDSAQAIVILLERAASRATAGP